MELEGEQETMDRISGLLSELIHEASEAVQDRKKGSQKRRKSVCKEKAVSSRPRRTSLQPSTRRSVSYPPYRHRRASCPLVTTHHITRHRESPKRSIRSLTQKSGTGFPLFVLIAPLLHIPQSLLTFWLDFCHTQWIHPHLQWVTMVFWACALTVTNLMVDQAVIRQPERWQPPPNHYPALLPGSY
ncbi:hypothetical protein BY458DRAFT_508719 [Sporodiniella umbellata]|nr:hypothetical protein BY458DRAFT_508719 [Sporodiniella umbellata]